MRVVLLYVFLLISVCGLPQDKPFYKEKYRPQFHFTPPIHWMNDPNGLVYFDGEYHLFYQFNPFGIKQGHLSWGHAISKDLIYWQHLPVAIGEEKDTMIFSGSCVVDKDNSTGWADQGKIPLVAIYTGSIEGINQSQHLAYSLDKGRTWKKYNRNPVLDLGKKDFRDPSVFWYAPQKKWVMAVALSIEKRIDLNSSANLKQWDLMSSFGPTGVTTGIWECPDLFEAPIAGELGKTKWVLMLSPAPYMQYFVGEFDGKEFRNENPAGKIYRPDYGADYYAAITYKNLSPNLDPISIGWASNWDYAGNIPTSPWKSAMSLPRDLSVKKIGAEWILIQQPVKQISQLRTKPRTWTKTTVIGTRMLPIKSQSFEMEVELRPAASGKSGLRVAVGNGQYLEIGYEARQGTLYFDRSKAGDTSFHPAFAKLSRYETAIRKIDGIIRLRVFVDKSILEVFINGGEQVMTAQFFPEERNNGIQLFSESNQVLFPSIRFWEMRSIWF